VQIKGNYKNAILITIDSLRWDSIHNEDGKIKPENTFFNKIAKHSIIFKNAFANGAGTPACFPSIMTSTYPVMYGGYKGIRKRRVTLAEILQNKGIQTVGIPNNAYLSAYFGYDRGFDVFYEETATSNILFRGKLLSFLSNVLHSNETFLQFGQAISKFININPPYLEGQAIIEKVKEIDKKLQNDFFLWIHFMDTHLPYYSPNITYEDFSSLEIRKLHFKIFMHKINNKILSSRDLLKIKKLYRYKIDYLENKLAALFDYLNRNGLLKKTIIILTADHGEEFLDHGGLIHEPKLYEELIHIPFFIYSKYIDGPYYVDELVEHIDIPPTILDALGYENIPDFVGTSLLDIFEGEYQKDYIISEVAQPSFKLEIDLNLRKTAIRTKKWKFIYDEGKDQIELFNILEDPKEENNVVTMYPELVKVFFTYLQKHKRSESCLDIKRTISKLKGKIL